MLGATIPGPHPGLSALAIALVAVLATWVVATVARSRVRGPRAQDATMDLGPEPPAVVNLLVNAMELTSLAVPATVLDLAARGWISVDELGPGLTVLRLARGRDRGPLDPHERRVLAHLDGLVVDGVVPAAALTTGPEDRSARWRQAFRDEVVDRAQELGLCRDRWSRATRLGAWALVAMALTAVTAAVAVGTPTPAPGSIERLAWWLAAVVATMVGAAIAVAITRSGRQRSTQSGAARAGHWLGQRARLTDHGEFRRQPAAAVTVWDRYLAQAVALGIAPMAAAQLPLGAESDRHAWSRETGSWRAVRVRYPRRRTGWGRHPLAATATALLQAGAALVLAWAAGSFVAGRIDLDALPDGTRRVAELMALVAGIAAVAIMARAGVTLTRAVPDVVGRRTVEGVVLRRRTHRPGVWVPPPHAVGAARTEHDPRPVRHYLAVDTGSTDVVLAWAVDPLTHAMAPQGTRVRARVTPRLGHVRDLEVIGPAPDPASAPLAALAVDAPTSR